MKGHGGGGNPGWKGTAEVATLGGRARWRWQPWMEGDGGGGNPEWKGTAGVEIKEIYYRKY